MRKFQEQLTGSARRLRARREAGLSVPPCPLPRRRPAVKWLVASAAAWAGLVGGWLLRTTQPVSPVMPLARADTVVVERLVRDTVVLSPVAAPRRVVAAGRQRKRQAAPQSGPAVQPVAPRALPPFKAAAEGAACLLPPHAAAACAQGLNMQSDSVAYELYVAL